MHGYRFGTFSSAFFFVIKIENHTCLAFLANNVGKKPNLQWSISTLLIKQSTKLIYFKNGQRQKSKSGTETISAGFEKGSTQTYDICQFCYFQNKLRHLPRHKPRKYTHNCAGSRVDVTGVTCQCHVSNLTGNLKRRN